MNQWVNCFPNRLPGPWNFAANYFYYCSLLILSISCCFCTLCSSDSINSRSSFLGQIVTSRITRSWHSRWHLVWHFTFCSCSLLIRTRSWLTFSTEYFQHEMRQNDSFPQVIIAPGSIQRERSFAIWCRSEQRTASWMEKTFIVSSNLSGH